MTSTHLLRLDKPLRSVYQAEQGFSPASQSILHRNPARAHSAAQPFTAGDLLSEKPAGFQVTNQLGDVEELLESIRSEVHALRVKTQDHVTDWQRTAVEIGMLVAAKFLRQEKKAGRLAVNEAARQLIEKLDASAQLTLYLNPADFASLHETIQQELASDEITVKADPKLNPGECRADDGRDRLFASLDLQLAELRQQLLVNIDGGADVA